MRPSPLETNGSHVEAVTRPLRLGEPSVGHPESTQPHPIRLRAEFRDLKLPQNVRAWFGTTSASLLCILVLLSKY